MSKKLGECCRAIKYTAVNHAVLRDLGPWLSQALWTINVPGVLFMDQAYSPAILVTGDNSLG